MPFDFIKTKINGLIIIQPQKFRDPRGSFLESYKKSDFVENGITESFIQDNHSCSAKGVLRGIHFQRTPMAQGKLVRVICGAVWDVAVDLRNDSNTFKQWVGIELSEDNETMFYVPPGFGHGFVTLKDDTHCLYKCTEEYSSTHDAGIKWDDPKLAIKWPLTNVSISEKDARLPLIGEVQL